MVAQGDRLSELVEEGGIGQCDRAGDQCTDHVAFRDHRAGVAQGSIGEEISDRDAVGCGVVIDEIEGQLRDRTRQGRRIEGKLQSRGAGRQWGRP